MTERTGKDAGRTIRVFSWALLVVDVLAYAALAVAVLATMGACQRVFARMGTELPTVTRMVLSLGQGGLVGILALVVLLAVVKEIVLPWPQARLWTNVAIALICAGFW
ncbi:unnamed protein product, partial [marine sediment metagenome]